MCAIKETIDWTHYALISLQAALSLPAEWVYSETGDNKGALSPRSLCEYVCLSVCLSGLSVCLSDSSYPSISLNQSSPLPSGKSLISFLKVQILAWAALVPSHLWQIYPVWKRLHLTPLSTPTFTLPLSPYYPPTPSLPSSSPPLRCQTRKCAQETAVPHVRPLAPGQVHPGNGAMCDRRHVADTVRGAVTVIRIAMNSKQRQDKNKAPCYLLGLFR